MASSWAPRLQPGQTGWEAQKGCTQYNAVHSPPPLQTTTTLAAHIVKQIPLKVYTECVFICPFSLKLNYHHFTSVSYRDARSHLINIVLEDTHILLNDCERKRTTNIFRMWCNNQWQQWPLLFSSSNMHTHGTLTAGSIGKAGSRSEFHSITDRTNWHIWTRRHITNC